MAGKKTTCDEDQRLINNRQNGRRRGRGNGQRPPTNVPSGGNRQDNRSRGNAVQLHEKYKALARDSQLAGDRVQTEYFLQFADHYYRVLNESRARFEEQRRQRDDYDDEDEGEDGVGAEMDDGIDQVEERPEPRRQRQPESRAQAEPREEREHRSARDGGNEREPRAPREQGEREPRQPREFNGEREPRQPREARQPREDREPRAPREQAEDGEQRVASERRPRRERLRRERPAEQSGEDQGDERISLEALPPPISAEVIEAPLKPRRRTRRPATDGGDVDIAPAA